MKNEKGQLHLTSFHTVSKHVSNNKLGLFVAPFVERHQPITYIVIIFYIYIYIAF